MLKKLLSKRGMTLFVEEKMETLADVTTHWIYSRRLLGMRYAGLRCQTAAPLSGKCWCIIPDGGKACMLQYGC